MPEPVDLMKPWTVKSVATRVSEDITTEARKMGVTTGQLLEKVWDAWRDQAADPNSMTPDQVTARMQATAAVLQGMAAAKVAGVRAWSQKNVAAILRQQTPGQAVLRYDPPTELSTDAGDK